jgi:RND superfamily putative drug exporter
MHSSTPHRQSRRHRLKLISAQTIRRLPIRAPRRTLAAFVAFGVLAAIIGAGTPSRLSNSEKDLYSTGTESYKTAHLIESTLGPQAYPEFGVLIPANDPAEGSVLTEVQKVATLAPQTVSSSNNRTVAVLGYFDRGVPPSTAAAHIVRTLRHFPGVLFDSEALVAHEFREEVEHDLVRAELIALPLLLLLAFFVFRSVIAAFLPVVVGVLTLAIALFCLRPINAVHPISILSLNLVTGAALGLSLDYSLLQVSRYREELAAGRSAVDAAYTTALTAGRTVTLSAATVTAAFASLLVFPMNFLKSIAIGGMLVAALAGLVSVTVLPAIFSLLGKNVNAVAPRRWQRSADRAARPEVKGAWYRLARFVMRHRITVAVAAAALLLTLATPSIGMKLTGLDATSLPSSTMTHKFAERVKAEFSHSLLDEVIVLARGNEQTIQTITSRYMDKLPDVEAGLVKHINGDLWVYDIKTVHPPFSSPTRRLVEKIRKLPPHLAVTGVTANYLDTAASLQSHLPLALAVLFLTTVTFLFLATGSAILPIKALLMNLLSLGAAFGILVFVFQDGRLEGLLDYRSQGALALTQPILLGAGTFGILTDYGIFLLTRIREAWDSGLPNAEAVALGVERTGRIVTAAALLFCVAVGALVTSHITFVKEAGIGVAAAVALDAVVVRALLVPSLMVILGRWNWWRPRILPWPGRERAAPENAVAVYPTQQPDV